MLDVFFILLLVIGVLFLVIGVSYRGDKEYWNWLFLGFSIVIFLALAGGVMNYEIPYQFYNVTTNAVETGYQVHGYDYSLSFLFLGFAVIEIGYLLYLMFVEVGFLAETAFRRKYTRRHK